MHSDFLPRRGKPQTPENKSEGHGQAPRSFQTPQEAQYSDEHQPQHASQSPAAFIGHGTQNGKSPKKPNRIKLWFQRLTKKQRILVIIAAVLLVGGAGFGAYQLFDNDPKPAAKRTAKQKPAPKPAEPLTSMLTGLPIADAAVNQRPVTAVMIENSREARPQAGLGQAGVVFEAIAEGGITRFLTLFQDTEPDYIGPVRSVRPYYVQWAAGFDAAVAHVGGSADALRMLRQDKVAKDLDQFFNPGAFRRVSNRYAPHNMYSNVTTLRELQTQKGFTSTFTGFARKPEAKSPAPNATSIDFNISSALYNPHYDYDAASNSYKRSQGGTAHTDERSGQINPKVVIGLVTQQGKNGIYTTYNTTGSGQAFVFQDGILTTGNWHKAGEKAPLTFTAADGSPLKLNPGQTWISVVGGADRVIYR